MTQTLALQVAVGPITLNADPTILTRQIGPEHFGLGSEVVNVKRRK